VHEDVPRVKPMTRPIRTPVRCRYRAGQQARHHRHRRHALDRCHAHSHLAAFGHRSSPCPETKLTQYAKVNLYTMQMEGSAGGVVLASEPEACSTTFDSTTVGPAQGWQIAMPRESPGPFGPIDIDDPRTDWVSDLLPGRQLCPRWISRAAGRRMQNIRS